MAHLFSLYPPDELTQQALNHTIEQAYTRCQDLGRAMMRINPDKEMLAWRVAYKETMEARKAYLKLINQNYYHQSVARLDALQAAIRAEKLNAAGVIDAYTLS